jgi:sec-independent protein translocase protein TatB
MFDIGFSEFIVIGLVALIVIGPERLPRVARTVGALLGRAQRYVNEVKTEVRREMEIEDLKKFQSQLTEQVRDVEQSIHRELRSAEDVARGALAEASDLVEPPKPENPAAAPAVPPSGAAVAPADVDKVAKPGAAQ